MLILVSLTNVTDAPVPISICTLCPLITIDVLHGRNMGWYNTTGKIHIYHSKEKAALVAPLQFFLVHR